MDLGGYEQVKFRLAEVLRGALALDRERPSRLDDAARDLFARLAEDRFNLVVVGRFSRGKSTLMNAVLGVDRLPTGIRPLTSVITTVTYGSRERALIHLAGLGVPQEVALSALPQFVTEEGNSANHRRVEVAEVQLPVELLRRGFYFIDTPGLGSPIRENTRTTERFLPEADAFILVTSYEGPLSEDEVRFLTGSGAPQAPVFIVVNKQDLVERAEREDALRYLRQQLRDQLDGRVRGIFSLSARDGLAAKQRRDDGRLEKSGLAAFERSLLRFLIEEKSREFLLGMARRVRAFLAALPASPAAAALDEEVAAIAHAVEGEGAASAVSVPTGMPDAAAPSRPCEICREAVERIFEFLRRFQYDITTGDERQRQLAERGGLCNFHTWIYERIAAPQGTCIGYAGVLDGWASRLAEAAAGLNAEPAVPQAIAATADAACMACEARAAAERAAIAAAAARLREDPSGVATLGEICLPHLRLLAAAVPGELAAQLLSREAAMLRRMAEDMRRYALKHDGLRRYLASEEEVHAAERALRVLAGHRALNTPGPQAVTPLRSPLKANADIWSAS
jgi:small GTP-binding protein